MKGQIEKRGAPWDRKVKVLEYRESVIAHEAWGFMHPGDPPKDYEGEVGA